MSDKKYEFGLGHVSSATFCGFNGDGAIRRTGSLGDVICFAVEQKFQLPPGFAAELEQKGRAPEISRLGLTLDVRRIEGCWAPRPLYHIGYNQGEPWLVSSMTEDEYTEYRQNGGQWTFSHFEDFTKDEQEFIDGEEVHHG